jgi:hypothetical protein
MSSTKTVRCPMCGSESTRATGKISTFDGESFTPDAGPRSASETESHLCEACWYRWDGVGEFRPD